MKDVSLMTRIIIGGVIVLLLLAVMIFACSKAGEQAANKLRFADSRDPEKILAYEPDLILLTKQHEGEMDAEQILLQSGIPLISFQPWNTIDEIAANIRLIGKVIGEEQEAAKRVEAMLSRIQAIQEAVNEIEQKKNVLVISPVGTNTGPFILGSNSLSTELLKAAGAIPAAELMGLELTSPASIEQIIKADPEYILLTDWDGEGERVFAELMETPGWNTLQAVQNQRMKMIDAKYIITPNIHADEGIEEIARWLYPEVFEGGDQR